MKVLIWILTFFIGAIINTLIGYATGIKAGSVLLFIGEYFIARKLCEKWDEKQAQKTKDNNLKKDDNKVSIQEEQAKICKCGNCGTIREDNEDKCSKCGSTMKMYEYINNSSIAQNESVSMLQGEFRHEEDNTIQQNGIEKAVTLFCRKCGCKLIDNAEFCNKCGTKVINLDVEDAINSPVSQEKSINNPPESNILKLAITTIDAVDKFEYKYKNSFVADMALTRCDTAIFSCFIIRAFCLNSASSREKAVAFSNEYIDFIKKQLREKYDGLMLDLAEMFDNRTSFYDRVFTSKSEPERKIRAVLEEFEYIIKTDIISGEYTSFSETSPLPVLGIDKDIAIRSEVMTYYNELPSFISPYFENVKQMISR